MIDLNIRGDIKQLERAFAGVAEKQLRFGASQAINSLAKMVKGAERDNMSRVLDKPTPFTLNSVAVKGSTKATLTATVYVKDIAASYLLPFEEGGSHKMIGRGKTWLNPKDKALLLNQYGNLPKTKLAALKDRPDMFVGTVKTKDGQQIDGLWQWPTKRGAVLRSKKGRVFKKGANVIPEGEKRGHLKLLMRFGDPMPVRQKLGYREIAAQIVRANLKKAFEEAMAKAIATAR
ncbi:hypothetical protein [Burkholderia pseudomallei]|uniref:hypothetical protein n=1 Tax=Burkholderia pseudomallei TaxID=28450 RepID=UPI000A1A21D1|nr:hypothetical protein [Burkholderia pseudomallei]ARL91009.1 hypothetical protein BOC57_35120 [Burkholderia pseudomallei]